MLYSGKIIISQLEKLIRMKPTYTFILLSFFNLLSYAQEWETVAYSPGNFPIHQIKVVSENNIYVSVKHYNLIRWDGTQWQNIGDFDPNSSPYFQYFSDDDIYATFNDYANGNGTTEYNYIAHWDGNTWSNAGNLNVGKHISKFHVINPNEIYAVGEFNLPGVSTKAIAKYNGEYWDVVGNGLPYYGAYATYGNLWVNNSDDIYATSGYQDQGDIMIKHWDGNAWSILLSYDGVNRMSNVYPASENEVYAFAYKTDTGESCLVRWNGNNWQILGNMHEELNLSYSGFNGGISYKYVNSNEIYAVGSKLKDANTLKYKVGKWNGTNWEDLGNLTANHQSNTLDTYNGYLYIAGNMVGVSPSGVTSTIINRYFIGSDIAISADSTPLIGGIITGSGSYNYGETATLIATPNVGYDFVNWTENGTEISTDSTLSFEVEFNRNLVANFILENYTVATTVNPLNAGITSGDGNYNYGEIATLTTSPSAGYTFTNWTENGEEVSDQANYEFEVDSDRSIVANFVLNSHSISADSNPLNAGTIAGTGNYNYGQVVTLTATANSNYTFLNWTENGEVISTDSVYEFEINSDRELIANFQSQMSISDWDANELSIYPNPFNDFIAIRADKLLIKNIRLYDFSGKLIIEQNTDNHLEVSLATKKLEKGVYLLSITTNEGIKSIKMIKN